MGFTQEELAAMAAADAEIEAEFYLTDAERREGTLMDREAKQQEWGQKRRKNAEQCKAYYEANRAAVRAKQAEYRKEHREEIREQKAKYYAENREAILAERRDRRQADPEGMKAYRRDYYQRNREKVLAKNKRYWERRKERERETD